MPRSKVGEWANVDERRCDCGDVVVATLLRALLLAVRSFPLRLLVDDEFDEKREFPCVDAAPVVAPEWAKVAERTC